METVTFAWNALKVALGLGFVIFIHELGHFLLAKWNGVKVEKFSVGFGPTLASFRRGVGLRIGTGSRPPGPTDPPSYGETEYILAALPLGGYVKMLGESTEEQPKDVEKSTDPRAFHNKPVGGRMAIITAGVIMNLILGFLCFSFVHTQPGVDIEPRVSGVMAGSPAFKAGLRAGDEIVAIDGQRDLTMTQVVMRIKLSGAGQIIHLLVKRSGLEGEKAVDLEPKRDDGSPMPAIGIYYPASSLTLAGNLPFSTLPGQDGDKNLKFGGFQANDKVVAIGPEGGPTEPVNDHAGLIKKLDELRGQPVVVEVDRADPKVEGASSPPSKRVKLVVPPHHFIDFGFQLTPGPIASVQPESPADRAGFKEGDRITAVDNQVDFDPIRLPEIVRDHAGTPMTLTIKRSGGESSPTEAITVTPDSTPPWTDLITQTTRVTPLDIPGLGLSIRVEPKIKAVTPGSPAAKSGLKVGDSLDSIVISPEKTEKVPGKTLTFASDPKTASVAWPSAFEFLQDNSVKSVRFLVNGSDQPIEVQAEVVADRYHPLRGLNFQAATRPIPPASFADALRLGAAETWDNVTGIYKIFRNLAQKRVGGDAFGGMIPIAQVAYNSASAGLAPFIQFLGFLSVNLAVLNFLPIPPLDGGQFLFLTAEKVRGKPLPDAYLAVGTIAGIAFVLILIVVINVKDVVQLVQSYL